jgi:hypothetical protein
MVATVWTPVGNVGKFVITPQPEIKKHYSSMTGTKSMDKIAIVSNEAQFQMDVDEWNLDNAAMALLGLQTTDTLGSYIQIGAAQAVERQLKFVGTNFYGGQVEVILPHVFMMCKDGISLIGDDWGTLTITGQILLYGGNNPSTPSGTDIGHTDFATQASFGTWRYLHATTGAAPLTAPNTLNYYIGKGIISTAPLNT